MVVADLRLRPLSDTRRQARRHWQVAYLQEECQLLSYGRLATSESCGWETSRLRHFYRQIAQLWRAMDQIRCVSWQGFLTAETALISEFWAQWELSAFWTLELKNICNCRLLLFIRNFHSGKVEPRAATLVFFLPTRRDTTAAVLHYFFSSQLAGTLQ